MSDAKNQQEPSMEEILASIRRIIAEDNDGAAPPDEAPIPEPEPEPEPMPMPAAPPPVHEEVLELTEVVEDEPLPEPEPFMPRPLPMDDGMTDGLVSRATAAASTAAFAAMHSRVRERRGSGVYLADGAVTLEEIVKELMRPYLQGWLDEHLPGLVERLVREEVERLARAAE